MPIESATRMPWHVVMHSVRTAVAPMVSLVVARLFGLVEAYWTPITTLVITRRRCERRCLFPGIDSSEPPWERWLAQLWEAKSEQRQLCLCSDPRTALRLGWLRPNCISFRRCDACDRASGAANEFRMAYCISSLSEVSIGIGVALVLTMLWRERADPPVRSSCLRLQSSTTKVEPPDGESWTITSRL